MNREYSKLEPNAVFQIFGSDKVLAGSIHTPKENIEIQETFRHLRPFQAISKSLQDESTDFSDVRYMFDKFLEKYPILSEFVSQNAQIVHSPKFESALIKKQEETYDSLDMQEHQSLNPLLKPKIETAGESFAHETIKKRKVDKTSKNRD